MFLKRANIFQRTVYVILAYIKHTLYIIIQLKLQYGLNRHLILVALPDERVRHHTGKLSVDLSH